MSVWQRSVALGIGLCLCLLVALAAKGSLSSPRTGATFSSRGTMT